MNGRDKKVYITYIQVGNVSTVDGKGREVKAGSTLKVGPDITESDALQLIYAGRAWPVDEFGRSCNIWGDLVTTRTGTGA